MNTTDLITALGWPAKDADKKGVLNWQSTSNHTPDPLNLPATASLVVTPRVVRATVLNIEPSATVQPHFQAEWDIFTGQAVLKKHILAGEDVLRSPHSNDAIQQFTSLVVLLNARPKIDILGHREKKAAPNAVAAPAAQSNP